MNDICNRRVVWRLPLAQSGVVESISMEFENDDVINFDMDIVYLRTETHNDGHHQHDVKLPPASHDSGVHVGI